MEEGREESEQQTYYLPKMRQTQLSRYELNRGSSNHSATVNSPGTTPLQGQGQLRYKWSPRERIYVSGRGQETAFGVVCPPSPDANPRQAVSRPISIISSKSLPSFRNEQSRKDGGGLGGVGGNGMDLTGGLECEEGDYMINASNRLLKCNSDGKVGGDAIGSFTSPSVQNTDGLSSLPISAPGAPLIVGSLPPTSIVNNMPPLHLPPLWDWKGDSMGEQVYSGYTKTLASSCPADVGWKYATVISLGREERGNFEQGLLPALREEACVRINEKDVASFSLPSSCSGGSLTALHIMTHDAHNDDLSKNDNFIPSCIDRAEFDETSVLPIENYGIASDDTMKGDEDAGEDLFQLES
eukprot:276071_1